MNVVKSLSLLSKMFTGVVIMVALWGSSGQCALQSEQVTSRPGEFLQQWLKQDRNPSRTLVVLDLDDTAITTPEGQWLGNSAMFYDQLAKQKEIHPGLNKGELSAMIDPLLEAVYLRVPVQLTDQSLPRTLRKLQHKGVTVIGMTARGDSIRQVTLKQLKQVGLAFSDLGKHRTLKLDGARTVHIEQGVVFVSHGNSKGETLIRLLKDGGGGAPDQVILIDDRQQHLTDVAAALSSSLPAIHYYPVFCDFPQKRPSFNREAAEVQLFHFLVKYQKDSPVNQLIQQDNFTRDFIRRCPDIQPGERCKKLLFRVQGSPFSGS